MIKRLARCIREYKWATILAPLTMVGEVTMEVLIPLVMADLYDYGVVLQDMKVVITKSVLLVLCALASLGTGVPPAAVTVIRFDPETGAEVSRVRDDEAANEAVLTARYLTGEGGAA